MRKASLFSGIGGIDLAAHWAGMETVVFCEREPFPQRVLRNHWPDVPIIDDVHDFNRGRLDELGIGAIDIVSAGYPCQPESHAGKRRGKEDDRWLWPEVRRVLEEIRPRWFVGENVDGHVSMGLDTVLADLGGGRTTPRKRSLFQLRLSEQVTSEIESSLWPTPRANSATGPSTHGEGGPDLQTAALWPTPRANDAEKRGNVSPDDPRHGLPGAVRKMWPTPKASDSEMGMTARTSGRPIEKSTHLQTQVHLQSKMWPTPTAQDAKNSTLPPSQIDRDTVPGALLRSLWPTPTASQDWKPVRPLAPSEARGSHGTMLVGAVGHQEPQNVGGQLNPEWVETLMNFPPGWTEV